MENKDLYNLAIQLRRDCMEMIYRANGGSTVNCFSCLDILLFLYFGKVQGNPIINIDVQKPHSDARDYVILSEWDCIPALYTVLANKGFFPKDELNYFGKKDALLTVFNRRIPGIEAAFSSFGHGLSYANGIALALKCDKKNNRVYVVMGAPELQIGEVWEAALTSSHHKLDNVVLIINNNKTQSSGLTRGIKAVDNDTIRQKFASFGWNVMNVLNGHDFSQLEEAARKALNGKIKPTVIICDTVLGKGIPFAEGKPGYNGKTFSQEEINAALSHLRNL